MKKAEEAIPTAIFDTERADQEMQAHYGLREAEYKPAFLYVERGPGAGQLLELKQGVVVMGRASVSDLRIQHPSISRRHAQVKRLGEQFFVKDLSSQNGTFINKQRLATEVEVKVGDAIAIGNAVVRLRGPMAKGEKFTPAPAPSMFQDKSGSRTKPVAGLKSPKSSTVHVTDVRRANSNNGLKIAIFAGAVGFGLAAAFAFALVKVMANQPAAPVAVDEAAAPEVTARQRQSPAERETMIQERLSQKMAAAPSPEEPQVLTPKPVDKGPVVLMPRPQGAVAPAPRPASRPVAAAVPDEPVKAAPSGKPSAVLAPYEKGNAEGALELSKKAGDKELSDKLVKFIQAFDAANEAMVAGNGTVAIANFQKALALDEAISNGWGKYASDIRRQLGNLYTLVGLQFMSNGDDDKAEKAFESALKHDPNNARAKQNLAKLSADEEEAPSVVAPAAGGRRVVTPGAPAPSAVTPVKKKPASIDDAFGD